MKIKTVTITGADNRTSIEEMMEVTDKFPFVEWGILFSPKRLGTERYPDFEWLGRLRESWLDAKINLSAHLCGQYTKEMLAGKTTLLNSSPFAEHLEMFKRFQLNFNATKHDVNVEAFFELLDKMKLNYILQNNYSNYKICQEATLHKNISFLYDSSGGTGMRPVNWQPLMKGFFTGYSGGLSPDNLEWELKAIESIVGDAEIWIDAETHLRTNEVLDMDKVKQFLTIARSYT